MNGLPHDPGVTSSNEQATHLAEVTPERHEITPTSGLTDSSVEAASAENETSLVPAAPKLTKDFFFSPAERFTIGSCSSDGKFRLPWYYVTEILKALKSQWTDIKPPRVKVDQQTTALRDENSTNNNIDPLMYAKIGTAIHKEFADEAALNLVPLPHIFEQCSLDEELFAVTYLVRPYRALLSLLSNPKDISVPEIPLIGLPLGSPVVIVGRMDSLMLNHAEDTLILVDWKTRNVQQRQTKPSKVKLMNWQLFFYRRMLEDFITGKIPLETVMKKLKKGLSYEKDFSVAFQEGIKELCGTSAKNAKELYITVVGLLGELPMKFELKIDYILQSTKKSFVVVTVPYHEEQVTEKVAKFFKDYPVEQLDATSSLSSSTTSHYRYDMDDANALPRTDSPASPKRQRT